MFPNCIYISHLFPRQVLHRTKVNFRKAQWGFDLRGLADAVCRIKSRLPGLMRRDA